MLLKQFLFTTILLLNITRILSDEAVSSTDKDQDLKGFMETATDRIQMEEDRYIKHLEMINSANYKIDNAIHTLDNALNNSMISDTDRVILGELKFNLHNAKVNGNLKEKEAAIKTYNESLQYVGLYKILEHNKKNTDANATSARDDDEETKMLKFLNAKLDVASMTIERVLKSNMLTSGERAVLKDLQATLRHAHASNDAVPKIDAIDTYEKKIKHYGIYYLGGDGRHIEDDSEFTLNFILDLFADFF